MFLAWFEANLNHVEGRDLTYAEFPTRFVYDNEQRKWRLRKKGKSVGRLQYIPQGVGELYYMRLLLTIQRGCTSYASLRTVNGNVHDNFQKACDELGLLADDKEFIDALKEAGDLGSSNQLRRLFVTMLLMHTMSSPVFVWESTWRLLSDGILFKRRRELGIHGKYNIYFFAKYILNYENFNLCQIRSAYVLTQLFVFQTCRSLTKTCRICV